MAHRTGITLRLTPADRTALEALQAFTHFCHFPRWRAPSCSSRFDDLQPLTEQSRANSYFSYLVQGRQL